MADAMVTSQSLRERRDVEVPKSVEQLLQDSVPKIGAEAFLISRFLASELANGRTVSRSDLELLFMHVTALKAELRQGAPSTDQRYKQIVDGAAVLYEDMFTCMQALRCGNSTEIEILQRYFADIHTWVTSWSRTIIWPSSSSQDLDLTFLEFDTEVTGNPTSMISDIVRLEHRFLIDPNLRIPQNGFGSVEDEVMIARALSLRESKLFAVVNGTSLEGFHIMEANQASLRRDRAPLISALCRAGYIHESDRLAMVRILGLSFPARMDGARAGVDLYKRFTAAIDFSLMTEGIKTAIGLVREGEQANTSIDAHLRVGWEKTSIIIHAGPDGVTPYRVIIRKCPVGHTPFRLPALGECSHFSKWSGMPNLTLDALELAAPIGYAQAEQIARSYMAEHYPSASITAYLGSYGYFLRFQVGGRTGNLDLLRPRTDLWRFRCIGEKTGTLNELLPTMLDYLVYGEFP